MKKFKLLRFIPRIAVAIAITASVLPSALANNACRDFFSTPQSEAVRALVIEDGFRQWLAWDQSENIAIFRKPNTPVKIDFTAVHKNEVDIQSIENLPAELVHLFKLDQQIIDWARHPHNTSTMVPFVERPSNGESTQGEYTASRSMALISILPGYTIKMPSDRPHGPHGEFQPEKANTADDIATGLIRTRHVDNVDAQIGKDPELILAREILTVASKATGHGFLVRDVRFMNDGNYYLPAFSLPYVGRKIALLNGSDPDLFWAKHYAEVLGRSKAKLLLRYGIEMETPNTQNMLIQLDRHLRPTGVLVFRDLSDSFFVESVGEALGFQAELAQDRQLQYQPKKGLNPFWTNSAWRLNEAGENSYSQTLLNQWGKLHDSAYIAEIAKSLGLKPESFENDLHKLETFLVSPFGKARLQALKQRRLLDQPAGVYKPKAS